MSSSTPSAGYRKKTFQFFGLGSFSGAEATWKFFASLLVRKKKRSS